MAAAALAKHLLVGRVVAGVHRRLSAYGALLWASQLLVESTIVNYGNILVGTWALNALYSAFGASIGKLSVIRNKTPAIGIPDMLTLGERIVCGDTTKIVTSMALGSQEVLVAPVIIENMGTIGAWAVIMPGVTVGQQATLAPLTIAEAGSDMKPRTVYMGAQAQPVKVNLTLALLPQEERDS
ncbi:hypothetical protein WJX73_001742 [Symbiochloris irregularis]|uniref:Uncharacterized protein n=1 Tax=Symbiochloris irregularis TaxID=706552 RepID=A0AAW1P5A2_9CHLO